MIATENIPMVLLPGMDGTGELLATLVDQLSLRCSVQVISYPATEPLDYDDLTAFVEKRTPKEPFVILGESFSGPIAIEIAAREPLVAGLILASSFARYPMPSLFAPIANMFDLRWMPRRIVEAALLGSTGYPELKTRLGQLLARMPHEIVRARVAEVLRVDKRNRLREITCPMLCLQGRFDWLVRKKCLDEMTSIQPKCQVRWFYASHMLLETHACEAAEAINEFCNRLR
ncbi:MAG: alpha/beta fold hydrolase [Hyphomicrobiaceae bacterium]